MYRNLKKALAALFLAVLIVPPSFAREISIATLEWPPNISSTLPGYGLNSALVKAAFEAAGHTVNIQFMPWTRALKDGLDGRSDVVMGAYYNKDRANKYIYSDLIYHVDVGLIARPGLAKKSYESLQEMVPYKIGITRSYTNSEEFDAARYLRKYIAATPVLNVRKLYRKRIDMAVMSFDTFRYEAEKEGFCPDRVTFVQPPLERHGLYIMGSKNIQDGQEIINDFNKGLKTIRANGTFDKILKTYRN
jgi:polar amino acid transport system substrate-binding protein